MKKDKKTKMQRFCLSALLVLLFVCLWPKRIMAAEIFCNMKSSYDEVYIREDLYAMYDKNYATTAKLVYDGFSEVIDNNNKELFYYAATEDVDLTLWASEGDDSFTYSRQMRGYCSDGYYLCTTQWEKEDLGLNIHLKKGEKVYLQADDVNEREGTFRLNCAIKKAQPIQSISVVSQLKEGYVQEGMTFDLQDVGTEAVVEVTYTDGRKQKLQAGYNQFWTVDAPSESNEPGTYNYTLYYRGFPVSLSYQLKSYADEMKLTPIGLNQDVEVPYNNGEYVGYSFVPERTGLYNIYCDDRCEQSATQLLVYEKSGRVMIDGIFEYGPYDGQYMLEGVEYQIYVKVSNSVTKAVFWIEDCMEYVLEGLEVAPIENQWYTGEEICPRTQITYKGKDIWDVGWVRYDYAKNKNPGSAIAMIHYEIYDEEWGEDFYGTVRIPFQIKGDMKLAKVSIPSYSYAYTGKAIVPEEKVTFEGRKLVRGKDYTVTCSNNVNAGTATLQINGIGDYVGSVVQTFTIEKIEQTIDVKDTFVTYKGAKAFSMKAKAKGALSYSGGKKKVAKVNKKGKIKVKGYGKVSITVHAAETENYLPASKMVSVVVTSKPSKIQSVKSKSRKKMTVKVKKATDAQGYEISYSTDKNFKKGVITKSVKSRTKTFKKLQRKKTYYVRVRTYRKVKGEKLYSKYSATRKVKIQ